jgi:carbonic anhydrase/acetyltransferase-like protein (isoleucine patch superfamily)
MAVLVEFEGISPRVAETAFLAPTAVLVGDVQVGAGASIWFGAVLRGDLGPIRVGANANVQDNVVIHAETGDGTVLEDRVTIGHGAILHDCWIGASSLIGMNAVVLDGARVGPEAIVAAGSVVREGFVVPSRMLAAGAPATNKKALEGEAARWIERGAEDYVELVARYRNNWRVLG